MAPVVDLKHRVVHGHSPYPLSQFVEEDLAAVVKVLIVDTHGKHKMQELPYGNCLSPRHLNACLQGIIHVVEVVITRIVGNVGQRHVGIQELHGLTLFPGKRRIKDLKIGFVVNSLTAFLEIARNPAAFIECFLGTCSPN